MEWKKIDYKDELNSKQKENYNFHKVAAKLAEYGFNSISLNDDWKGADFIAVHVDGEQMLKIQLKGRFTVAKKYEGKDIWIAFIEDGVIKIYEHDEAIKLLNDNVLNSKSWSNDDGVYSWGKTPAAFDTIIKIL